MRFGIAAVWAGERGASYDLSFHCQIRHEIRRFFSSGRAEIFVGVTGCVASDDEENEDGQDEIGVSDGNADGAYIQG